MYPCPRLHCNGTLGIMGDICSLCARGLADPRPPTAEEAAGEVVRNSDRLYKFKMRRRREAKALKALKASLTA